MSKIIFTERAFEEYLYCQSRDKKTLKRINTLLKDIGRNPFEGIGKPEGLKGQVKGQAYEQKTLLQHYPDRKSVV